MQFMLSNIRLVYNVFNALTLSSSAINPYILWYVYYTITYYSLHLYVVLSTYYLASQTSNATIWTLYCLAKFPEAQDALYQEICKVLPFKGQITPEKIAELPYVKACLKETFRYRSSILNLLYITL